MRSLALPSAQVDQFGRVASGGHVAMEVVVFCTHGKALARRALAKVQNGGTFQAQKRRLARPRQLVLQRRREPVGQIFIQQQLQAAAQ